MRTFKYRLYPTKHQQDILWFQASCLNKLYNFFLNLKKNTYQDYKISLSDCGLILDRDHNAAINILCLGQAFLEKECSTVI